MKTLTLDGRALEAVAGHLDESLRLIESRFLVRVAARGDEVVVTALEPGGEPAESVVVELLRQLADLHDRGVHLGRDEIRTAIGKSRPTLSWIARMMSSRSLSRPSSDPP
jgi:phosphate starvation-inducible protein PhoH